MQTRHTEARYLLFRASRRGWMLLVEALFEGWEVREIFMRQRDGVERVAPPSATTQRLTIPVAAPLRVSVAATATAGRAVATTVVSHPEGRRGASTVSSPSQQARERLCCHQASLFIGSVSGGRSYL